MDLAAAIGDASEDSDLADDGAVFVADGEIPKVRLQDVIGDRQRQPVANAANAARILETLDERRMEKTRRAVGPFAASIIFDPPRFARQCNLRCRKGER